MAIPSGCYFTYKGDLLKISNPGGFHLQLQLVRDQRDKLWICGFALGIADGIAEKSLECVQITTIPRNLNSMSDSSLHTAGCGLECFRYLGVEHLGDGVDGVPTAHLTATAATFFVDDL